MTEEQRKAEIEKEPRSMTLSKFILCSSLTKRKQIGNPRFLKLVGLLLTLCFPVGALSAPVTVSQTFSVDATSTLSTDGNGDPWYVAASYQSGDPAVDPTLGELVRITISNSYTISRPTTDGTMTLRIYMYDPFLGLADGSFGREPTVDAGVAEFTLSDFYDIQSGYDGPNTKWDFWLNAKALTHYADVYSHTSQPSYIGTTTVTYYYEDVNEVPLPSTLGLLGIGLAGLGLVRRKSKA